MHIFLSFVDAFKLYVLKLPNVLLAIATLFFIFLPLTPSSTKLFIYIYMKLSLFVDI